jgi:LysM repeat protein
MIRRLSTCLIILTAIFVGLLSQPAPRVLAVPLAPQLVAAPEIAPAQQTTYVVRPGDNLISIAARFGTTVQAIMSANGITDPNRIYVGQVLRIPTGGGGQPGGGTQPGTGFYYTVQRGDTLSGIAYRFGTTVQAIMAANGLANANYIYVGQRLLIPGRSQPPTGPTPVPPPASTGCYHTVQRGESLSTIARLYGVNPYDIARSNGIVYPYVVYVGQRLLIPTPNCAPAPLPTPVLPGTPPPLPTRTTGPALPTATTGTVPTPILPATPTTVGPTAVPPTAVPPTAVPPTSVPPTATTYP